MNIPFDPAKARGWHLNREQLEIFLNALSFVFPPGEKFFIHSVRHYENRITDPVLKEQVRRFIYQKAMHSKEHSRCNVALKHAFPHGHKIEKRLETALAVVRRLNFKSTQLAMTCAIEHFTAILSDGLLRNQQSFLTDSDPEFASLWLWHAVEEAEHKAVCFDVFQYFFGKGVLSYLHRTYAMVMSTAAFLIIVLVALASIKKGNRDRKTTPESDKTSTAGSLNTNSLNTNSLNSWHLIGQFMSIPLYLDYYRYSFHPWDHDNRVFIEEWKQRYKDFGTTPDAVRIAVTA